MYAKCSCLVCNKKKEDNDQDNDNGQDNDQDNNQATLWQEQNNRMNWIYKC